MTGGPPPAQEVEYALGALRDAYDRLKLARSTADLGKAYAAAGEAIWWVCAVDEHFSEWAGAAYEALRDHDNEGQEVLGVIFARNQVSHQLALLIDVDTVYNVANPAITEEAFVDEHGWGRTEVIWRYWADVPEPQRRNPRGAEVYRRHLQGQYVVNTIGRVGMYFEKRAWPMIRPS